MKIDFLFFEDWGDREENLHGVRWRWHDGALENPAYLDIEYLRESSLHLGDKTVFEICAVLVGIRHEK